MASGMDNVRFDLNPKNFEDLIKRRGVRLKHYRAMPCFCRNPQTGQADPTCTYCDGKSVYYFGEHEIRGVCTGIGGNKEYAPFGALMFGTMILTTHAEHKINYYDRIEMLDSKIAFGEFLMRGQNPSGDKLRFHAISVDKCLGADAVEYFENVDFTTDGRFVVWKPNKGPAVDEPFSICYMMRPAWLVISHAHLIRDAMVLNGLPRETHFQLPVQATCKLEWLVSQSEISG